MWWTSLRIFTLLLAVGEFCVLRAEASAVTPCDAAVDAGPGAIEQFGTDGYDAYGVVDLDAPFGESGNTGNPRVTRLPSYIAGVTLQGTDTYYGSPYYSQVVIPGTGIQRIGLFDNVLAESMGGLGQERSLLSFEIGGDAPPVFYLGVILDGAGGEPWAYPDLIRLRSTLFSTSADVLPADGYRNSLLDVYFFAISGSQSGETLALSGLETDHKTNGFNNVAISGLVFTQSIPEPATLTLALLAVLGIFLRKQALPAGRC